MQPRNKYLRFLQAVNIFICPDISLLQRILRKISIFEETACKSVFFLISERVKFSKSGTVVAPNPVNQACEIDIVELDTIESLDMTAELVEHPEVKKEILACKDAMLEGEDFSKALAKSNIFSTVYTRMASIGYKTGALDDLMERISASYEDEINASMSRALSILEPALVAILSVIVGLILLSVMLPLLGIMSNIG